MWEDYNLVVKPIISLRQLSLNLWLMLTMCQSTNYNFVPFHFKQFYEIF